MKTDIRFMVDKNFAMSDKNRFVLLIEITWNARQKLDPFNSQDNCAAVQSCIPIFSHVKERNTGTELTKTITVNGQWP